MYIQDDSFVTPLQMCAADSRIYWDILTYFEQLDLFVQKKM